MKKNYAFIGGFLIFGILLYLLNALMQSTHLETESRNNITGVRSWVNAQQLYVNINANLALNETQIQTLKTGIPLVLIFEIKAIQERHFFYDKTIAKQTIKYQLEYHVLSNQYIVTDLNEMHLVKAMLLTQPLEKAAQQSNSQNTQKLAINQQTINQLALDKQEFSAKKSFPTLSLAINFISHLKNMPIGTIGIIKPDLSYQGSAQIWLDIEALPTPMQLPAFFDSNWKIQTPQFNWQIMHPNDLQFGNDAIDVKSAE